MVHQAAVRLGTSAPTEARQCSPVVPAGELGREEDPAPCHTETTATLGGAWGILQKKGRKYCRSQLGQGHHSLN